MLSRVSRLAVQRSSVPIRRLQSQSVRASDCSNSTNREPTFSYQPKLPLLPVPNLEETCRVYLDCVTPILQPHEYQKTKDAVEEFLRSSGPVLQKRLLEHADMFAHKRGSWLWQWWLDLGYMTYRESSVINSNYFCLFDDKTSLSPVQFAARLTEAVLSFKSLLEQENVPVDKLRGVPVCMNQYKLMFTCCRVPRPNKDQLRRFNPSTWIMAVCNAQFFIIDVYDDDGNPLSINALERAFEDIKQEARKDSDALPLGAVTADNRDIWAKVRNELVVTSETNRNNLDLIERSLFCVSLDDASPENRDQAAQFGLAGNSSQRWHDKLCNFIVFSNGYRGMNAEHSPVDAPVLGTMINYVNRRIDSHVVDGTNTSPLKDAPVRKLKWMYPTETAIEIKESKNRSISHSASVDSRTLFFEDFGASWIKQNAKMSPDAFVQMSIQLAYYRLHGCSAPTYESASTRKFLMGRTDTCKTLSTYSQAWTRAMVDRKVAMEEKKTLLYTAVDGHLSFMKRCTSGLGIDRHLMSLKHLIGDGEPTPALFADSAYARSRQYRISTSNMNGETFAVTFGPTERDGYGICYQIRNNRLQYGIASFNECTETDAAKMRDAIADSLKDMKQLIDTPSSKL